MKLIERNNNNGQTRTISILERLDSREHINLVLDGVYSRGLGIKHFVVDAPGKEQELALLANCPTAKPYVAIGRMEC